MVEDLCFLFLWFLFPFLWHLLLKSAGLSILRVSIPSIVIVAIYIYQYVGLPVLYFKLDWQRAVLVTDKYLILQVFFFTSITMFFMLFGFIIARGHCGSLDYRKYVNLKSNIFNTSMIWNFNYSKYSVFRLHVGLLLSITASFLVLIVYLSKVGIQNVALFVALNTTSGELSTGEARSAMGTSFDGSYHWYKLFTHDVLIFSLLVLTGLYLIQKRIITFVLLVPTFIIATLVMVMATEKTQMAELVISLFLVYALIKNEGKISIKKFLPVVIVLVSILSLFYIYFMDSENLESAIFSLSSRLFTGQIQSAYHYLDYFQNNHDYLLGRSFPNPGGIFPFEHTEITTEVMAWQFPNEIALGIVGSMPTIFWGDMYANFGILGVLFVPFFVGYLIYFINSIVLRQAFNPLSVGLFVWLILHFKVIAQTSITSFFMDIYMLSIITIFIILSFFTGKGIMRFRYR
ncbi:MAG: hypothetical protein CMI26_01510 [Opitutae bacterium]|nr:hypothetical protein [Opitutae bacterium]